MGKTCRYVYFEKLDDVVVSGFFSVCVRTVATSSVSLQATMLARATSACHPVPLWLWKQFPTVRRCRWRHKPSHPRRFSSPGL